MKNQTFDDGAVDLLAFEPADSAILEILQPGSNKPTGWKITIAGPSHQKTIDWNARSARDALRKNAILEAQRMNGRKIKPEEQTLDEVRRENTAWVVARIIDWTPVRLGPNGETLAFSEKAAADLLVDPRMNWVYAQILEFLNDERSFTRASGTT